MKKIYDPLEKLRQNPTSLRAAINAKCWDCVGMDSDPAPKWRIGNCHMSDCGLFAVRPYQDNLSRPMPVVLRPDGEQGCSESTEGVAVAAVR